MEKEIDIEVEDLRALAILERARIARPCLKPHMLDNGADIRHVQEQLGHASLQTTQVYAQVSLIKLKESHARTHPSSKG